MGEKKNFNAWDQIFIRWSDVRGIILMSNARSNFSSGVIFDLIVFCLHHAQILVVKIE